jgi:hypothetical protein
LDDLNLQSNKIVSDAFDFIISYQNPDGSWSELVVDTSDEQTEESTMSQEEYDASVYLTAYCAHWLVRFRKIEQLEIINSALNFLNANQHPSGLISNDQQASWDALVLFSFRPGLNSDTFVKMLEVIEKKFQPDISKGSDIAYLLCCLRDTGLGPYHPLVNLCIDELIQKQQDDGSWVSEYGEEHATGATLDALRVLKHYNVV